MADREFRCASCNRVVREEEFFEGIRKNAGPRGAWGAPVCEDCRSREAKGLPIERQGEKAICQIDGCPDGERHPVICVHCEMAVLAGNDIGPVDGCEPNRQAGTFDHGPRHYACSNERAHRE